MIVLPPEISEHLGSDPFQSLMAMQGEVYRKQPMRETIRIELFGQLYFLKKHFGVSLKECVKNLITGKLPVVGAKPEWKAIKALDALKIATTPLVGYGQQIGWPFIEQSFLLTKALEETVSLEALCQDWSSHPPSLCHKRRLIREVARIVRIIHHHGWVHRDLYLCHFLQDKEEALHLIDLHRMFKPRFTQKRWVVKDLAALYFSSMDCGLTRTDLCAFLTAYTGLSYSQLLKQDHALIAAVNSRAKKLYVKAHGKPPQQSFIDKASSELPSALGDFKKTYSLPEGDFEARSALRVLPNRRWVMEGEWKGKKSVAKFFTEKKDYEQELASHRLLNRYQILCPTILYHGQSKSQFVIIYEWVEASQPLDHLSPSLMKLMAHLHNNNVIQEDCHRHNFLIQNDKVYALDAGGMVAVSQISLKQAFDNLALLFAQWTPVFDAVHLHSLSDYCQARRICLTDQLIEQFKDQLFTTRLTTRKKWLKKIFRQSTAIESKHRFFTRFVRYRDFANLSTQTLFHYPEAYFHPQADYLKKGNSATVVRVKIGEQVLVIKRFNRKNIWAKIKRVFSPSKAARAWKMSHALSSIGIQVPRPLAFIEKRFGPIRLDSYFICEYVEGERLDHLASLEPCEQAIHDMMTALQLSCCQHGDLKASNILWTGKSLVLLDTDAARFYRSESAFQSAHAADWARLLRNWEK